MKSTIDFNIDQFVLIDKNRTEHILTINDALNMRYSDNVVITDSAKDRFGDMDYDMAIAHYLGELEE